MPVGPSPAPSITSRISRAPPLAANAPMNMVPAATIKRIIAEIRTVIASDSRSIAIEKR